MGFLIPLILQILQFMLSVACNVWLRQRIVK